MEGMWAGQLESHLAPRLVQARSLPALEHCSHCRPVLGHRCQRQAAHAKGGPKARHRGSMPHAHTQNLPRDPAAHWSAAARLHAPMAWAEGGPVARAGVVSGLGGVSTMSVRTFGGVSPLETISITSLNEGG
eukprot:CAMPEP_0119112904 /NCGR_PEP_ID=MMETSP1180-20130426/42171_1 /TAXON_ID=3052 ORGANISM="Chlamydomonas cf sp, Strain CCMP681" /NCGR_SAMPLE_ID=MMETSP1180 /ASSEMBLY_ACC=CAM_ASM_000741 /LENGTH=131 /DNA_ID=CAMNT_0007100681 /DNA_START=914 /DNA_END=1308 /DNA_ORIENTATION=+